MSKGIASAREMVRCKRSSRMNLCASGMTNPSLGFHFPFIDPDAALNERFSIVSQLWHICGKYSVFNAIRLLKATMSGRLTEHE
jgi:hypothetical protein